VVLRDADGFDKFFVETGQCAIGEEWLKKAGNALRDVWTVAQDFEHVGDDAARGEKGVVRFLRVGRADSRSSNGMRGASDI